MNETEDKSKSKEKRLEEQEKVVAETQRSYAVAEMKKAHKLIEETEKSRKLPAIRSICQRIDAHGALLAQYAIIFGVDPFGLKPVYAENARANRALSLSSHDKPLFRRRLSMIIQRSFTKEKVCTRVLSF